MALKKFIGARYAPEFAGAWSNTKQYAALSVVYANNRSYVSRKTVPAGTAITNTEFWIQSSDWNAQVAAYNLKVEEYKLKVEEYNSNVNKYNKNVQDYSAAVSGFYADTLHSFDTKADMQADRTLALGETLLTCGDKAIGDDGGSFYQVVSETSATAVALDNGLFAEPFKFQLCDTVTRYPVEADATNYTIAAPFGSVGIARPNKYVNIDVSRLASSTPASIAVYAAKSFTLSVKNGSNIKTEQIAANTTNITIARTGSFGISTTITTTMASQSLIGYNLPIPTENALNIQNNNFYHYFGVNAATNINTNLPANNATFYLINNTASNAVTITFSADETTNHTAKLTIPASKYTLCAVIHDLTTTAITAFKASIVASF